jgi:hypothetical protein
MMVPAVVTLKWRCASAFIERAAAQLTMTHFSRHLILIKEM